MIELGKYHDLRIVDKTNAGLFVGDEQDKILLPNNDMPYDHQVQDVVRVFVYRDGDGAKVATTVQPKIVLNEFAFLEVSATIEQGAFLDWGLDKDLFVPRSEQRQRMAVGRWYVVYLDLDQKTDRLFASNKLDRYLQNDQLTVENGQEVELLLRRKTDLGYSVIIDHKHQGLIYDTEIFDSPHVGQKRKGFIKTIRDDNKIDVSLQAIGFLNTHDANCRLVHEALLAGQGILKLSAKSPPELIYRHLGISKKAFKKAVGTLYKERRIAIEPDGIRLLEGRD